MTSVFQATEASLAHRAHIAELIAPYRRIRPRTPFWNLRIHRVPTLWSLYRGLLRDSPTDDVRWRIRRIFERYRHLTSPSAARAQLLKYHKWADTFAKAKAGDAHLQAVLLRYSDMVVAKRNKEDFKQMLRQEFEWQRKLQHRPILTGAYLRPSIANPPLPRMRPQPEHISGMIHKRRKATNRQWETIGQADVWLDYLRREKEFEEALEKMASREGVSIETVYSNSFDDWAKPIYELKRDMRERIVVGLRRRDTPYPPEMLEAIKQARREKIANKTREREREARGEILRRTIFRSRAGPPAHVLVKMTPRQKHLDKVSRSNISEVGYVGMAKRKLGWTLRNPNAWKVENGKRENLEQLNAMAAQLRQENERKWQELESENNNH